MAHRSAVAGVLMTLLVTSGLVLEPALVRAGRAGTTTPVKYLVVIFDENNSFDHYFGTYPYAANLPDEPRFDARDDTPVVNGLTTTLLRHNPNVANPFRLDRSQALTCDNDNHYTDEQEAYDSGLLDSFQKLSGANAGPAPAGVFCPSDVNMGYYDGNTVTALWNYAQHFAMSDNFFATTFGTTVMGHLNLIAGQTHGVESTMGTIKPTVVSNGSVIANIDPITDDCATGAMVEMAGPNIGDLLNARGVSWGWFYGDWTPTTASNGTSKAVCNSEYDSHYAPFQYYATTANPHHLPPTGLVGESDQANHQYAITDLWNAAKAGYLPEVTFIKPPHVQNGHPADSTPLAEQQFLVDTINALQQLPQWDQMAIMITYDDSDGWYDHVMPPIVSQSDDGANDMLAGPAGHCGTAPAGADQDRCGHGPRLPFLLVSPFARENYVDHGEADQASIIRFIEDNWDTGRIGSGSFDATAGSLVHLFDWKGRRSRLFLDDMLGVPVEPNHNGFATRRQPVAPVKPR